MTDIAELVKRPWLCGVTGNPVGTDTRMVGEPLCECQGCRASRAVEALEAERDEALEAARGWENLYQGKGRLLAYATDPSAQHTLDEKDWNAFSATIGSPPEANDALKALMRADADRRVEEEREPIAKWHDAQAVHHHAECPICARAEIDSLGARMAIQPPATARDAGISVAKRVAELSDRTSPEHWPEAMLVTADELIEIVADELQPLEVVDSLHAPSQPSPVVTEEVASALRSVVEQHDEWCKQMGNVDFDDPLSDAVENARAVLSHLSKALPPPPVSSASGTCRCGGTGEDQNPLNDPGPCPDCVDASSVKTSQAIASVDEEVTPSCGCVFCDVSLPASRVDGEWVHQVGPGWITCNKLNASAHADSPQGVNQNTVEVLREQEGE